MTKEELLVCVARRLESRAALICEADDPMEMVRQLRPEITDPEVNGGAIPSLYIRIACREIRRRAELSVANQPALRIQ